MTVAVAVLLIILVLLAHLPLNAPHPFAYLQNGDTLMVAVAALLLTVFLIERKKRISLPAGGGSLVTIVFFLIGAAMIFGLPARRITAAPGGLGDGLWLVEILPLSTDLIGYWSSFDEMLEPLIRSQFYRLGSMLNGEASLLLNGSPDATFFWLGIYSSMCGILQLTAIAWFSRKRNFIDRISAFLLLFFIPSSQLFAGYIEHYSFAALAITITLLFIWSDLEHRSRSAPYFIAAISAVGALHHLIVGFLLPGLILYIWKRNSGQLRRFLKESLLCAALALSILSAGWMFYFNVLELSMAGAHIMHPPILPLHKIVSSVNFFKMLFMVLLCSPVALAWLLHSPFQTGGHPLKDDAASVVGLVSITFLIQAAIWNPVIGMPADWDLLSLAFIPVHVLILRKLDRKPGDLWLSRLSSIAAVTVIPTLLWLSYNHHGDDTQGREAIQTARSVSVQVSDDPIWHAIPVQRKRELLLLHLVAAKRENTPEERSLIQDLLARARKDAIGGGSAYEQKLNRIKERLQTDESLIRKE